MLVMDKENVGGWVRGYKNTGAGGCKTEVMDFANCSFGIIISM